MNKENFKTKINVELPEGIEADVIMLNWPSKLLPGEVTATKIKLNRAMSNALQDSPFFYKGYHIKKTKRNSRE